MKSRYTLVRLLLPALICLPVFQIFGQQTDSTGRQFRRPLPYHWNTLKINFTPMIVWGSGRNITISYERLVNRSQSIALQVGFLEMPRLFESAVAGILYLQDSQKGGVNIALDYRFYLSRRNTRPAPDGVYLGPYISYYRYRFWNDFTLMNSAIIENGRMTGGFDIINVGLTLGYQFIFWKRFSVDLLFFGPCMSIYSGYFGISADLNQEIIDQIDKDVIDRLLQKYPFVGYILHNDETFRTGYRLKFSAGFRYSIQLGFHF